VLEVARLTGRAPAAFPEAKLEVSR
jgi:hypothetical protein